MKFHYFLLILPALTILHLIFAIYATMGDSEESFQNNYEVAFFVIITPLLMFIYFLTLSLEQIFVIQNEGNFKIPSKKTWCCTVLVFQWSLYSDVMFFKNSHFFAHISAFSGLVIITHNLLMLLSFTFFIGIGCLVAYFLSKNKPQKFAEYNYLIFLAVVCNIIGILSYLISSYVPRDQIFKDTIDQSDDDDQDIRIYLRKLSFWLSVVAALLMALSFVFEMINNKIRECQFCSRIISPPIQVIAQGVLIFFVAQFFLCAYVTKMNQNNEVGAALIMSFALFHVIVLLFNPLFFKLLQFRNMRNIEAQKAMSEISYIQQTKILTLSIFVWAMVFLQLIVIEEAEDKQFSQYVTFPLAFGIQMILFFLFFCLVERKKRKQTQALLQFITFQTKQKAILYGIQISIGLVCAIGYGQRGNTSDEKDIIVECIFIFIAILFGQIVIEFPANYIFLKLKRQNEQGQNLPLIPEEDIGDDEQNPQQELPNLSNEQQDQDESKERQIRQSSLQDVQLEEVSRSDICPICRNHFLGQSSRAQNGQALPICQTKCEHIFHRACIEKHLKKHEECPICRREVE